MDYTYWNKWSTPFIEVLNENHNTKLLTEEVNLWGKDSVLIDGKFLIDRDNNDVPGRMIKNSLYESSFQFFEEVKEKNCPELLKLEEWIKDAFRTTFFDFFTKWYSDGTYDELFEKKNILEDDIEVEMEHSWLHLTANNGLHGPHSHRGYSWVMIYYINIGDSSIGNGNNMFHNFNRVPSSGIGDFGDFYRIEDSYSVIPEDGKMVIFPGDVVHSSQIYKTVEKTRIVIAGNLRVYCEKWWRK